MIPSDIEDNVRWDTTETEWSDYDAPWEPVGGEEASERESWTRYYESVRGMAEKAIRWRFEIEWEAVILKEYDGLTFKLNKTVSAP